MKPNWKKLIWYLAIPLLTGGLSAWLTAGSMKQFAQLRQPPLAPPGWVFPIVWTLLFLLMGASSYLIAQTDAHLQTAALRIYGIQLAVNFFWPILFFRLSSYLLAFFWLLLLWALVLTMILLFYRVKKSAAWLQLPYLLWITFAGYLNLAIYFLN